MALIRRLLAVSTAVSLGAIASGCQIPGQRPSVVELQQPAPRTIRAAPAGTIRASTASPRPAY